MYDIFLFLVIFFGVFGAVKALGALYAYAVDKIISAVYKKEKKEYVKIYVKR